MIITKRATSEASSGRADDTTITNAENKENTVAGAHNVGGVAGYLGGNSTIDGGINNGGDITGTGARTDNQYTGRILRLQQGILNLGISATRILQTAMSENASAPMDSGMKTKYSSSATSEE